MNKTMTRRVFLGRMGAGLVLFSAGCSQGVTRRICGSEKGSLRLVFYTDVHTRTEWGVPDAIARAAAAINAQKPDMIIAGGDLITDGFQSSERNVASRWDAYMSMHRSIAGDIYPVIGNHDLVGAIPRDGSLPAPDPRQVFRDRMGLDRTDYSFDALGYHFIILDSIQVTGGDEKYKGMIGFEALEWMKRDLSGVAPGTPIVIALHLPLLTTFYSATEGGTSSAPDNRVVVNNLDVLKIFEGHNVILVLQGHLHVKELLVWRGTTFITGGAVCGKWWRGHWHGTEEGFAVVTLSRDHVDWQYIAYGWDAKRPSNQ
jgi:3',5'-cyclic-AMP phosphodiesterase